MLQWKYLERYKMDWSGAVAASGGVGFGHLRVLWRDISL